MSPLKKRLCAHVRLKDGIIKTAPFKLTLSRKLSCSILLCWLWKATKHNSRIDDSVKGAPSGFY